MKTYHYRVYFHVGSSIDITAGSEADARILAQAEKIRDGLHHAVSFVTKLD